jgi:hypothetical protein
VKCIACQGDCTYPQRSDRRCPTCKHEFAFEPRTGDLISDAGFLAAIDAASSHGTVRFLPDHVYYQIARRKRRGGGPRATLYTLGGLSLFGIMASPVFAVFAIGLGAIGAMLSPSKTAPLGRGTFEVMWRRWVEVHGAPPGLIVRREQAPYRGHSDIEHYSFDRAVICDRAQTVDVLLANNFHFENNCAVLSVDGYPQHAFPMVRAMLKNNPRLTVYALHDASSAGCVLAHTLAHDPTWFRGSARVVEVGLRPVHAANHRGVWQDTSDTAAPDAPLTKTERAWLGRYVLELAAIRPEQIIKRLYAAIAADAEREVTRGKPAVGGVLVDERSLAKEARTSDGGYDSFG